MPRIGAHLSVAPLVAAARSPVLAALRKAGAAPARELAGPLAALERARLLRCETVQMFLRPSRQWRSPVLAEAEAERFRAVAALPLVAPRAPAQGPASAIHPILSHASYLINCASPPDPDNPEADVATRSAAALADELDRAARLRADYLVLHPGSHLGAGPEAGLRRVVEALDAALDGFKAGPLEVLVETTAGQGTAVGWRLEELKFILDHVACPERLGVCCDMSHMFAAGYDFRTPAAYEATVAELDRVVGLVKVKAWHLNDSLRDLGSRVDRHAHIGQGQIGLEAFRMVLNDRRFAGRPFIIETPKEDAAGRAMDPVNLRTLRKLVAGLGDAIANPGKGSGPVSLRKDTGP